MALLGAIRRSLAELDLGLRGDLTMSEGMERLMHELAADAVPASWAALAYPSLRPLSSWMGNLAPARRAAGRVDLRPGRAQVGLAAR